MEIIQQVEAPKALVQLIRVEYQDLPIEKVILCGGTDQLFGRRSVFVPETKSVIIDMRACMEDQRWMKQGLTYVANVWVNLVYCVLHEGAHAIQLDLGEIKFDPERWDTQHALLDEDADRDATEWTIDWFIKNPGIPPLNALGWVGQQIQQVFNGVYAKASEFVDEEILLWGAGMSLERAALNPSLRGDIEGVLKAIPPEYRQMPEAHRLIDAFQKGGMGLVKNGRLCLRIDEALELVAGQNRL